MRHCVLPQIQEEGHSVACPLPIHDMIFYAPSLCKASMGLCVVEIYFIAIIVARKRKKKSNPSLSCKFNFLNKNPVSSWKNLYFTSKGLLCMIWFDQIMIYFSFLVFFVLFFNSLFCPKKCHCQAKWVLCQPVELIDSSDYLPILRSSLAKVKEALH